MDPNDLLKELEKLKKLLVTHDKEIEDLKKKLKELQD